LNIREQETRIMQEPSGKSASLRTYAYILIGMWTATVFGLLLWGISKTVEGTRRVAIHVAQAHFDKDRAFRLWAASHGGVYVPVDDRTPVNQYLEHVPERDLSTPSGKKLTLMNPAYMLRQLHKDFAELYRVTGHITSLKPLRPENRPDEWEKSALVAFEQGEEEVTEFTAINGKPYLRLIKPLKCMKGCLKCHSGYKEGDIRGGVGISLPLDNFFEIQRSEIEAQVISHGSIFLVGFVGIVLGIRRLERRESERGLAQEALQASERKYRRLFDDSRDGVFMTSRSGELLEANQAVLDIFGYTVEEMVGMDVRRLYVNSSDRAEYQEVLERTGSVKDYEVRLRKKDGTLLDCLLTSNVRFGKDGSVLGYQGIIRDVTQQKRDEQALKAQAKELQRSNADLEEFAFVASHDLQEPLRNVTGCVQLLGKKCEGKLDPDADKFMGYTLESVARMRDLIDDLLTYSRVGTKGTAFEQTDCEQVLDQVVANLAATIDQAGAVITRDPLPTISGDPRQLVQVFQNLIANAIKFHQNGQAPTVHVSAVESGHQWTFAVKDSGIGIERQYLDRIFMVFQRLHRKAEYEGTGIGLAIVKKIVNRHGGEVWVESEPGVGTTFFFTLPKQQPLNNACSDC
jgi:chemotaxis family two-component system sensor kinase Cph1